MTLPASFWSMVCASLGFGSLLMVPAKPLRELGVGGVVGTIVAQAGSSFWDRKFMWIASHSNSRETNKKSSKNGLDSYDQTPSGSWLRAKDTSRLFFDERLFETNLTSL